MQFDPGPNAGGAGGRPDPAAAWPAPAGASDGGGPRSALGALGPIDVVAGNVADLAVGVGPRSRLMPTQRGPCAARAARGVTRPRRVADVVSGRPPSTEAGPPPAAHCGPGRRQRRARR